MAANVKKLKKLPTPFFPTQNALPTAVFYDHEILFFLRNQQFMLALAGFFSL